MIWFSKSCPNNFMKKVIRLSDEILVNSYCFELMDSRTYMLREGTKALVIDPCEDEQLIEDLQGVSRITVILTHEHYDHISGVNFLKEKFDCCIYAGSICAKRVESPKDNLSDRFAFLFLTDREKYHYVRSNLKLPFSCRVDESFCGSMNLMWQKHQLELYEVGGHSPGSIFILLDNKVLFAGDNLLENGKQLQGTDSDRTTYEKDVKKILDTWDLKLWVLPGHGEEKRLGDFNRNI